jgi:hypothetical protein
MTHCVADAWEKLHREHSSIVQKSFQQNGIALDPEGSEDHLLSVKDLPNLAPEIGDRSVWEEGGLQSFFLTLRRGLGFVAFSEWSLKPAHHQVQNPRIALLGSACHWPDPNPKPLRKVRECAKSGKKTVNCNLEPPVMINGRKGI